MVTNGAGGQEGRIDSPDQRPTTGVMMLCRRASGHSLPREISRPPGKRQNAMRAQLPLFQKFSKKQKKL
ncbi:MAG TPA: hypothetical protein DCE43_01900 [Planctomycetaceae bacterium]|nr:hypothetical protein [Planctomycetaceae bacterium]